MKEEMEAPKAGLTLRQIISKMTTADAQEKMSLIFGHVQPKLLDEVFKPGMVAKMGSMGPGVTVFDVTRMVKYWEVILTPEDGIDDSFFWDKEPVLVERKHATQQ